MQPTNRTNIADVKVYCARPGSRLWEADVEGRVLKTSQYKPVDISQSPTQTPTADNKQSLQLLRRLQPIFGKFIFSHTKDGFCIVDPSTSNIVLCNDHQFHDIDNIKIVNGTTLIIFTSKSQLFSLSCRSIEDCFVDHLTEQKYDDCVKLLLAHRSYFYEMCRTAGFGAQVLRLQNALAVDHQITDDLKTIFSELTVLQQKTIVPVVKQDNGVFAIDNGFTMNAKYRTSSGPTISADENIRTVLMSASRNLFNKLNIFNDSDDVVNTATVSQVLCDRPIIPYQNVDELDHSDEIVAAVYRPNRIVVQRETTSNSAPQHIVLHKQLTAEDKLLQNLFMIYKSSRMSQLSLVERYSAIFDQYDCHSIRELLQKLAIIMQQNNIAESDARLHCYEMYFNYLNHDLIWEFDDETRQFIINGFILINQPVDTVILCIDCSFPLMLRKPITCRYRDIGATVMKYFWTRNQLQQCFELAAAVPWTVELLCKFWLNNDCRNDVAKVIRLVFATNTEAMWLKAIQCPWFGDEAWIECFELMVRMHRQRQMICANCDKCSTIGNGGNAWHTIESHEIFSWSCFLDSLVNKVHGRKAIRLVRPYSSQIPCDGVPKEFYLKCLLEP